MHTHTLNLQRPNHREFLAEARKDCYTGKVFAAGDEIVFCATPGCRSAHLAAGWRNRGCCFACKGLNTLEEFPAKQTIRIGGIRPRQSTFEIQPSTPARSQTPQVTTALPTPVRNSPSALPGCVIAVTILVLLIVIVSGVVRQGPPARISETSPAGTPIIASPPAKQLQSNRLREVSAGAFTDDFRVLAVRAFLQALHEGNIQDGYRRIQFDGMEKTAFSDFERVVRAETALTGMSAFRIVESRSAHGLGVVTVEITTKPGETQTARFELRQSGDSEGEGWSIQFFSVGLSQFPNASAKSSHPNLPPQVGDSGAVINIEQAPPTPASNMPSQLQSTLRVIGVGPGDTLNVRQGPSQNTPVVAKVSNGYSMTKLGDAISNDQDFWIPVEVGGIRGYVNRKFVEALDERSPLRIQKQPSSERSNPTRTFRRRALYPVAMEVSGKPGFVVSPYAPHSGYVDVRGFPAGTEVRCPYTRRIFTVP